MTPRHGLGEFEIFLLAALQHLGDDAYALTVQEELRRRARRRASVGAIHAGLGRLEEKGYVSFRISEPLPVRGGRARKYARITASGARALRTATESLYRMLDGLTLGARP